MYCPKCHSESTDPDDAGAPHPGDVQDALMWLRAGCPVVSGASLLPDAHDARKTLIEVLERLPKWLDRYCYGTDVNRRLMGQTRALTHAERASIATVIAERVAALDAAEAYFQEERDASLFSPFIEVLRGRVSEARVSAVKSGVKL